MRIKALGAPLILAAALMGCGGGGHDASSAKFSRALAIPPILAPVTSGGVDHYDLTPAASSAELIAGVRTRTYGYNGMDYLGPTIRLTRGRPTQISLHNQLPPDPSLMAEMEGMTLAPGSTSLHLHGLICSAEVDLTPSYGATLQPGGSAIGPVFTPDQPSATLWYHPHPHMDTGRQIYEGLAGMMIMDDPADASLALPNTYGVDDLPVIVQDRRFKADGSFDYLSQEADMEGILGDRILVNGVESPYAAVPASRVRLRLLNASNRRTYLFALSDGRPFQQIATDGGYLSAPATVTEVKVPPAGRAEVVVDFSGDPGKSLFLVSRAFPVPTVGDGDEAGARLAEGAAFPVMQIRVGAAQASQPVPSHLATLPPLDTSHVTVNRQFDLEKGADDTINGKLFDMNRVDDQVHSGAWEIWTVTNWATDLSHPWHVHGIQFRVLDRSSGPLAPNDQGWKDTVLVGPGETVRMLMHFDHQDGLYMYHCHILEHGDMGMMGQFVVAP
ncbi:MAG: multicopper oxidase domain-containing protein [Acidobacteria bacterium]|nr:multicopper oxidase domain-containing protein [Acidobacteriota bacterium]